MRHSLSLVLSHSLNRQPPWRYLPNALACGLRLNDPAAAETAAPNLYFSGKVELAGSDSIREPSVCTHLAPRILPWFPLPDESVSLSP